MSFLSRRARVGRNVPCHAGVFLVWWVALTALTMPLSAQSPAEIDVPLVWWWQALESLPVLQVATIEPRPWVELTPLVGNEEPLLLHDRGVSPVMPILGFAHGAAVACIGSETGVGCDRVWLEAGEMVELTPSVGTAVTGRYVFDEFPVEGARVSVVPLDVDASRPFVMPLDVADGALIRDVRTDEDGVFLLPPLATGRYRLETLLPSGRLHHDEPFDLPTAVEVRTAAFADEDDQIVFQLGTITIADALAVSVLAVDEIGRAVPGVKVSARQGETADDLLVFEATTDRTGRVVLSGVSADMPVDLRCIYESRATWHETFELAPVEVTCQVTRHATLRGVVSGPEGLPLPVVILSLDAIDEDGAPVGEPIATATNFDRQFTFGPLDSGRWLLTAAAPGFAVERLELDLAPAEQREESLRIRPSGVEWKGRVVDREGGPVVDATITSIAPAGLVRARSDGEGAFTFSVPRDEPVELEIRANGYARHLHEVPAAELAGVEDIEIVLRRAGQVEVLIADHDSEEPCQGCKVRIHNFEGQLLDVRVTDRDGFALSAPLAPGWVEVEHAGVDFLGSIVVERPRARVRRVEIMPDEVVEVSFADPVEDLDVVFRPAPAAQWWLSARNRTSAQRHRQQLGRYHLERRSGDALALYLVRWDASSGAEVEIRQTDLRRGDLPDTVELRLPSTSVHGRLLIDGEPRGGVPVRLDAIADNRHWARATTAPDGGFHLPHVVPGVYRVVVGERAMQNISLRADQELDLRVIEIQSRGF
ncbi:MAG: hypothetical protein AAGD38_04940 [Acidobacteriota bacterium]